MASQNLSDEYSFCNFPITCGTPPLLADASFSRRSSMESFESSYSTATDYSSPITPSPLCRGQEPFIRRRTTPPDSEQPLFEGFTQAPYLAGLPEASVGELYGFEDLDADFRGWDCANFDDGRSSQPMPNGGLLLNFGHFAGPMASEIRQDLTDQHYIYQNVPPTVLPSQTLKSPNPPASALATPFVSPIRAAARISPDSSPDTLRFDFPAETEPAGDLPSFSFRHRYVSLDRSPSWQTGGLTESYKRTASRKRSRQEDQHDEDAAGNRLPLVVIPWKLKPHPCHTCSKGFDRQEHLTRHNKTKTHRASLQRNNENQFVPPIEMVQCPFCDRDPFDRSDNLKAHVRTHLHDGDQNFKNKSISVEESMAKGYGDIDPRINKSAACKKGPSKKARTRLVRSRL